MTKRPLNWRTLTLEVEDGSWERVRCHCYDGRWQGQPKETRLIVCARCDKPRPADTVE